MGTYHCRMLESMGLEKMGGEVLATVGLGSNPSISRKKCALRGDTQARQLEQGQGLSTCVPCNPPAKGAHTRLVLSQPALCWTLGLWGLTQPREVLSVAPSIHRWVGEDSEIQQLA